MNSLAGPIQIISWSQYSIVFCHDKIRADGVYCFTRWIFLLLTLKYGQKTVTSLIRRVFGSLSDQVITWQNVRQTSILLMPLIWQDFQNMCNSHHQVFMMMCVLQASWLALPDVYELQCLCALLILGFPWLGCNSHCLIWPKKYTPYLGTFLGNWVTFGYLLWYLFGYVFSASLGTF